MQAVQWLDAACLHWSPTATSILQCSAMFCNIAEHYSARHCNVLGGSYNYIVNILYSEYL